MDTHAKVPWLVLVAFGQLGLAVDRALKHRSTRRSS